MKRDNEINQNFGKGSSRNSLVAAVAADRKIKKEGKNEGIKEKTRKRTEREGGKKAEMKLNNSSSPLLPKPGLGHHLSAPGGLG